MRRPAETHTDTHVLNIAGNLSLSGVKDSHPTKVVLEYICNYY